MSQQALAPVRETCLKDRTMLQQAQKCSACGMRMSYVGGLRGFGFFERRHSALCLERVAQNVIGDRMGMSATLLTSLVSADGKSYEKPIVMMASPELPSKIPTHGASEKFCLKPSVGTWMMHHRHLHDEHTAEPLQNEEEDKVPSNGRRSSIFVEPTHLFYEQSNFVEPVLAAAVEVPGSTSPMHDSKIPDLVGLKITYTATSGIVLASEVVGRVVGKVIAKQNEADLARDLNKVATQQNGAMASEVLQPSLKVFLGWKNIFGSSQTCTGTVATADAAITSGELFETVAQLVAGESLENSTPPRKASGERSSWSPPTPSPIVAPTGNATLDRRLAAFMGTNCGTNREPVDESEVDMTAVRSKWEKRAVQQRQQQWAKGCAKNRKANCAAVAAAVEVHNIATKPLEFGPFQYTWEQHVQTPLPTHLQNERRRIGIDEEEWHIRLNVTDNEGFFLDLSDPLREDQFPAGVSWEEAPCRHD